MRIRYMVFVIIFWVLCINLGSEVFTSMLSGPWGEYETWWGSGGGNHTLPGPTDDVIISAYTDVTGGGMCHNLTVMGHPTNPGRLLGPWNYLGECQVRGDLVCDGVITFGTSGTYYLEVWGNISVNGHLNVNDMTLMGTSESVFGRITVSQAPGAVFYADIDAGPVFPGLRMISDLSMFSGSAFGILNNMEIDIAGHQISQAMLYHCYLMDDPPADPGTLSNCWLSDLEAFIDVIIAGNCYLLSNDCVFHSTLINTGYLDGPLLASGSFVCGNLSNLGYIRPGWQGTLNIFCNGDMVNMSNLESDVVFTSEHDHCWTESGTAVTMGSFVNMSANLLLLSNMTLDSTYDFYAGGLNLNGNTLTNAWLHDGDVISGGGTLAECSMSSLNISGNLDLDGILYIEDNSVVFNGPVSVDGELYGGNYADRVLYCNAPLTVNGTVGPGYGGTLELRLAHSLCNLGTVNAGYCYFTGPSDTYLDWGPDAVFGGNITNQSPLLHLSGSDTLEGSSCVWELGDCVFDHPIMFYGVTLLNSQCSGIGQLTLSYATLTNTSFAMPVCCSGLAVIASGTSVEFASTLLLQGLFYGADYDDVVIHCLGDVIVESGGFGSGYGGRLIIQIRGGLNVMGGMIQSYRVIFSNSPLHVISQAAPSIPISTDFLGTAGESIQLGSDLALAVGSSILLNGGELDLNQYCLSDAIISAGAVYEGSLTRASISSIHLQNVELHTWTLLADNGSDASSTITNLGTFYGADWANASFTCLGDFVNQGSVIPGYGGSLAMRMYGDVENTGTWYAATILLGSASRTLWLNTPGYSVSVTENSHPLLSGSNLLSSFSVLAGSQLTVDTGATLAMSAIGEYYVANADGQGVFTNHGSFSATLYVNGMETIHHHQLDIEPTPELSWTYSAISCTHHYNEFPSELPAALGEVWYLQPEDSEDIHNAAITFRHSGSLLPREFEMDLRLFYRLDDLHPWQEYSGDYVVNLFQHTFKALDIPAWGQYAFVATALDIPQNVMLDLEAGPLGHQPKLSWASVVGAFDYEVMTSDVPEGPWNGGTYTSDTFWIDSSPAEKRFFRVRARRVHNP